MTGKATAIVARGIAVVAKWVLPATILCACGFLVLDALIGMTSSGGLQLLQPVWNPGNRNYGVAALLVCTLFAALPATLLTVVLGIPCALHMAMRGSSRIVVLARMSIGVWYGVPSIVVGIVVLAAAVPVTGFTLLTGLFALVCMVFPGFVLSLDALIRNADFSRFETLKACGFGRLGCLYHGLLPEIRGETGALVLLTLARALGEATAASLVIGGIVTSVPPAVFKSTEFLASAVLKGFPVAAGDYMVAISVTSATLLLLIAACTVGAGWLRSRSDKGDISS